MKPWEKVLQYKDEIEAGEAIAIIWTIDDVEWIANLAPIEEYHLKETLRRVKENHDALIGVNWDVIETTLEQVLREGP